MSDSDDEDLKKAIALSLQEDSSSHVQSTPTAFIDLISSDVDEDDLDAPVHIRAAMSSNQSSQKQKRPTHVIDLSEDEPEAILNSDEGFKKSLPHHPIKPLPVSERSSKSQPQSVTSAMMGLDRKQMEAERLARFQQNKVVDEKQLPGSNDSNKRKASYSEAHPGSQNGRLVKAKFREQALPSQSNITDYDPLLKSGTCGPIKEGSLTSDTRSLHFHDSILGTATKSLNAKQPTTTPNIMSFGQEQNLQASGIQYPDGVVKRTWVKGCPRGDDIKIEEVLQKEDLELAVLSTFQVEPHWVAEKLLERTKVMWVLQAKDEFEKQNFKNDAPSNFSFCFPSMAGNIFCMHSKLQLLAHPAYLRIAVPSANLVPYDWGETGVMENTCFLIDLPRLPQGKTADPGESTEFGKELLHFATAMGLPSKLIKSLGKFDFSRTSHIRFIHTIGGSHSGADWKRTGYCGLGTAIKSLGLATNETLSVDFVTSSLGSLTESYIKSIYLAAQGDDGWTEYGWRYGKRSKGKASTRPETEAERQLSDDLADRFRIFFPTDETVKNTRGGMGAGGTICFQSRWFDSTTFPRHLLRDCKSRREGLLMHNKMIFVQPGMSQQGASCKAWVYVGSANLTESAWGRLVKDKITKEPKMTCRNWECGVVFPVPPDASGRAMDETGNNSQGSSNMEIFRGHVPVPMVVPGEKYREKRPWFFQSDR